MTADTSHLDMSALKSDVKNENNNAMLVTPDTSQPPIDPCGPLEQSPIGDVVTHSLIASRRNCSLDCGEEAAVEGWVQG